jgi:hypothetical protein
MKTKTFLLMMCLILVSFFPVRSERSLPLHGERAKSDTLDNASKAKIVEEIAKLITDKYVFPNAAKEMATYIRSRLKENAYDQATSLSVFIQELTKDLRSVNKDAHLGIVQRRGPLKKGVSPEELYKSIYLKRAPFRNYGFIKAERLMGNVGCLVIDEFTYLEMDGKNFGGGTAKAAMTLISNCFALIID